MTKIVVLDDVLSEPQRMSFMLYPYKPGVGNYEPRNSDQAHEAILSIVHKQFDLSRCTLYEIWCHHAMGERNLIRHVDNADAYRLRTGKWKYPICGIVYYAEVSDLVGGEFCTDDVVITPKTNRLIMFAQGTPHKVNDYTGMRWAVAINPWERNPNIDYETI